MTAYHLGDMLDNMPYTPNSRSVEVYVNGSYQGVYLLCEAVNVAKSRIAITEDTTKIEDDGYLVEMSRYAEENVFTVDCCRYEVKVMFPKIRRSLPNRSHIFPITRSRHFMP